MMKTGISINSLTRTLVVLCFLLTFRAASGMKAGERIWPLSVSVFSQKWAFPFYEPFRLAPFHPGFSAGILRLRIDKSLSFPQSATLGYFYNSAAGSAIYISAGQSIRFAPFCGFFADFSMQLGFLNAFHPRDIYRYDNGVYRKAKDFGKPSFLLSFSQTIGYDFSKNTNLPLAPFIKYQWIASYPYFDMVFPVRPSSMFHLGTIIYF